MNKILFLLMIFQGCSTVKISSTNPSVSLEEDRKKVVSIEIEKEFFVWGLIPERHDLNVHEFLREQGYSKIKEFSVQRERRAGDVIWSILSLGVYTPQTFILKAKVE